MCDPALRSIWHMSGWPSLKTGRRACVDLEWQCNHCNEMELRHEIGRVETTSSSITDDRWSINSAV